MHASVLVPQDTRGPHCSSRNCAALASCANGVASVCLLESSASGTGHTPTCTGSMVQRVSRALCSPGEVVWRCADEGEEVPDAAEASREAEQAEAEEFRDTLAEATAPAEPGTKHKKRKSIKDHVSVSESVEVQADGILSDKPFDTLDICEKMQKAITEMGFQFLTQVQHATIPPLLQGRDLLGAARTGAPHAPRPQSTPSQTLCQEVKVAQGLPCRRLQHSALGMQA